MKQTILLLLTCSVLNVYAVVPTDRIAAVRERLLSSGGSLSDSDRAVVNEFWRIALDAMLLEETSEQIVAIRRQIEQEKGDEPLSLYATGYVQVGREHLKVAFETVEQWEPSEKKDLMRRNLMILATRLESPLLADFGLERLSDLDEVVRYWAVKCVAGPQVAAQLIDPAIGDPVLTEKILHALRSRVSEESNPEILRLFVSFSAIVNNDLAREILMIIAQKRIDAYMSWNVQNEQFDAFLLRSMGQIILEERESPARTAMARRFAELLSLVFQRYMADPSPLSDAQRNALATVITEVDNYVLTRIMGQQTPFIRILQRGGMGLDREFEAYFGSDVGPGHLATRLKFDYGKTDTGQTKYSPPQLPPPPAQ
jgi:hypothetical protein